MVVEQRQLTAGDLWGLQALPENEGKDFELIDGELHEVTPSSFTSGLVAIRLAKLLGIFVDDNDLGYVIETDVGVTLSPGNVLEPDVAFIAKARVPKLPERFFEGAPDLVVEVVSPTDSIKATHRKMK